MKKIYGIGTGPGDKDLLTIKAVKKIRESKYIFAPNNKGKNMALETAREYVEDKKIIYIDFPMGEVNEENYRECAKTMEENIEDGEAGAFLTIGDPTFYSTFMNTFKYFGKDVDVEIISGIPSFVAAAGSSKTALTFKGESFMLTDSIPEEDEKNVDSMAILKAYKITQKDLDRLKDFGFSYKYVKRASFEEEKILEDDEEILRERDYISLLLARRK